MPRPSATLTVWASAWLAGAVAADDVLDALGAWADAHDVQAADPDTARRTGLPEPGEPATSVPFLLAALRRAAPRGAGRFVLPAPGDVRGLPPPGRFASRAVGTGEGAVFDDAGFGLVPAPIADGVLRWTVEPLPPPPWPPVEFVALPHAEQELREQVRRSAAALAGLGVARDHPGARDEIAEALRRRPAPQWPAGMPPRAVRVLAHADEVSAIVTAAALDEPGGALSASAADARRAALQPLSTAVRVARRAAVAEAVRVLAELPQV